MAVADQPCYTLLNIPTDSEPPNEMQLRNDLEKGDLKTKADALRKTIQLMLNGEKYPSLLMTIIRFVLPLQDHTLKKLLLIFWEIVPKTSPDGKLLQEMILVCDAYRKDLQHPNEFIRGSTLRFLCKLKEAELLEPLMPAIRACLEHRHSYVRRNAVLAVFTIYKSFDFLIPDAPELVANFLEAEQDMSCKRNAFMMLVHVDQERALAYLDSCLDQVQSFGDILQLVIVELIYKVCHTNPAERSRFIRCIYNLLNSSSPAVRYEAAGTLVTLSAAPTAIKAAATCYIELIVKESDNNVKLIVLDRLIALRETQERILQELAMDVLRVLAASDLEVRRKTLALALDLVSSRNVEEMVLVLRKEVAKTHNTAEHEDTGRYRQLLVRTLHSCCVRFPDAAPAVIPVLMEFLSDNNEQAAADVLAFVREAVQRFEQLRPLVVARLLEVFGSIKSSRIHRGALWLLGEYCASVEDIRSCLDEVRQALGELPLVESELRKQAPDASSTEPSQTAPPTTGGSQRLVTADGTYATQSAFSSAPAATTQASCPPLRGYLMEGDFFVGAAMASDLTKLAVRYLSLIKEPRKQNAFVAECMLVMTSVLHLGRSGLPSKSINDDDGDRICLCLKMLSDRSATLRTVFGHECRQALSAMLAAKAEEEAETQKVGGSVAKQAKGITVHADDPICFGQLAAKGSLAGTENMFEVSLHAAVASNRNEDLLSASKLSKVTQLTGFSDPVYAEAYVHVNQYDIALDVLVVNQTADTLQSCTLELATLGDLRLVEKPSPVVLAPHDFCNIRATVKVASTENGIIFGNIVYDVSGSTSDRNVVVLNDIHIDIMDYIVPASCTDTEFRQMWAEFEWENKVSVNTTLCDLPAYLQHLIRSTNMKCLTPEKALSGECGFMAANLYARSIFGEDALANVSIEKNPNTPDAPVVGHIRIRAKSQGMALSLGDKINSTQKSSPKIGA
uniref:Coatomer subunit beta n=1 Tax=Amblyomma aureolatum TaxID=187763 RepID=A0A1E1X3D3_9ACAR